MTVKPLKNRENININNLDLNSKYNVHVMYFNQNEVGETQTIDEIKAQVEMYNVSNIENEKYYKWISYQIRTIKSKNAMEKLDDNNTEWIKYSPGTGFEYIINGSISSDDGKTLKTPNMDSIPKDLTGFKFYINIIDFHMWQIYKEMFFMGENKLQKIGDKIEFDMSKLIVPLVNWENTSSDGQVKDGFCQVEYIADRGIREQDKVLYFMQNQKISQNVYGQIGKINLKMPYYGTTRFLGFYIADQNNDMRKGEFNEYVYGRVNAPFFTKVLVHNKRFYTIERIE
jgi:hypothetical protein